MKIYIVCFVSAKSESRQVNLVKNQNNNLKSSDAM